MADRLPPTFQRDLVFEHAFRSLIASALRIAKEDKIWGLPETELDCMAFVDSAIAAGLGREATDVVAELLEEMGNE